MDDKSKKEYIRKNWKVSSGKKISEMLRRYWQLKVKSDIFETAKKLFNE